MRTAVIDGDSVELWEDGTLIRVVYAIGKSIYYLDEIVENWINEIMPVQLSWKQQLPCKQQVRGSIPRAGTTFTANSSRRSVVPDKQDVPFDQRDAVLRLRGQLRLSPEYAFLMALDMVITGGLISCWGRIETR